MTELEFASPQPDAPSPSFRTKRSGDPEPGCAIAPVADAQNSKYTYKLQSGRIDLGSEGGAILFIERAAGRTEFSNMIDLHPSRVAAKRFLSTFLVAGAVCGPVIPAAPAAAATMAWVYSFTGGADGANPIAGLTLKSDGTSSTLYGAAFFGGANGQGTLFSIPTTGGTPTVLHAFNATAGEGAGPGGTPVFDSSGTTMLGTTTFDSINSSNIGSGNGTVYSYALSGGAYSVVHAFTGGADGANSYSPLLYSQCSNVTNPPPPFAFYGTTTAGGTSNRGTVFKITTNTSGAYNYVQLTSVTNFTGFNAYAPVACDNFSTLYGTTVLGGSVNRGLAFQLSSNGASAAAINQFSISGNGGQPRGGFYVQDGSHLFGTATVGGASGRGAIYQLIYTSGTNYSYNKIYDFVNGTDGSGPWATLVKDAAGNLYGTTIAGGASGNGTVYKLTKSGSNFTYSQIYSFSGSSDGANPYEALVVDSQGNIYGTTKTGGATGNGTIFKLLP